MHHEFEPIVIYGEGNIRVTWEILAVDVHLQGYWKIFLGFQPITDEKEDAVTATLPAYTSDKPIIFVKDIVINQELQLSGLYLIEAAIIFMDNNNKPMELRGITSKPKPIYIYKKIPPASRRSALVSVEAYVLDGMRERTNILPYDDSWTIHVEWNASIYNGNLFGNWQVQTYLDPLGPGSITNLEASTIPLVIIPDQQTEYQSLDILVEPHCVAPGIYKIVIVVTNVDQDVNTTDVLGFYQIPSLIKVLEAEDIT